MAKLEAGWGPEKPCLSLGSLCVWCEIRRQRLVVEIVIPGALGKNAKQK